MPTGAGMTVKLSKVAGSWPSMPKQLVFQCPPLDQFTYDVSHSHDDYESIDTQYSRRGTPQLTTVQFDTLAIADPHPDPTDGQADFTVADPGDVDYITQTLTNICLSGRPFFFQAAHDLPTGGFANWALAQTGPSLQMYATLRTLSVTEKAGEPDAIYYTASFTEYRDPTVPTQGLGARPGGKSYPQKLKVSFDGSVRDKAGHLISRPGTGPGAVTLSSLAKQYYGDPSKGALIAKANGITSWGNNDPLIQNPKFATQKIGASANLTIPDPKAKQKNPYGLNTKTGGFVYTPGVKSVRA